MWCLWAAIALSAPLEGRILERGTGNPIPEVSIRASSAEVLSDEEGRFTLELPDGTVTLLLEGLDHKPLTVEVQTPTDDPVRLYLTRLPTPHEIIVESFRPSAHVTRHIVDAEMAHETPGTHDDAVRLVQSLPGVAVQREFSPSAGSLSVRGSAPSDNRTFLDGIEVPYLYHFNQYASVFPTSQIGSLELFSSAFGASYGDAVGAVVDAESKATPPDAVHGSVAVNTIMAGGDVQLPLSDTWWGAVAARRSFHDIAGDTSSQYTVWPRFYDAALRLERGDEAKNTGLFALAAGDAYDRAAGELDVLDPLEQSETPSFSYRRDFFVVGARHRWRSPAGTGRLVGAIVADRLQGTLSSAGSESLRTLTLASRLDSSGPLKLPGSDAGEWRAGWEIRGQATDLRVADANPAGVLVALEAPALARGVDVDDSMLRLRAAPYAEAHWVRGSIRVIPGLRLGTDTGTEQVFADPRLAVRWQLAEQSALKLGGGRYHQTPETEHLLPGTGRPDLPVTTAWQIAGGLEQTVASRLEISLEAYGKELSNVLTFPVDGPAEVAGRGTAWGVELTTRYRLRERFFLWGWVATARTAVHTDEGRSWGVGDQPIAGGIVGSWDPSRAWNLGVRYRFGSGLPFTSVAEGLYDGTRDTWFPALGALNGERMPFYQKVDLQVARTWEFKRWSLTLRGEVWYVPRSSAQLYPTWSYDYSETTWVIGPTLLPLAGARGVF